MSEDVVVDLSEEQPGRLEPVKLLRRPYDQARAHDKTRRNIAYWLLLLLTIVVTVPLIALWRNWLTVTDIDAVSTALITPVIGLVGAVTGFYFGQNKRASDQEDEQ